MYFGKILSEYFQIEGYVLLESRKQRLGGKPKEGKAVVATNNIPV
jgi:hypothetical protein